MALDLCMYVWLMYVLQQPLVVTFGRRKKGIEQDMLMPALWKPSSNQHSRFLKGNGLIQRDLFHGVFSHRFLWVLFIHIKTNYQKHATFSLCNFGFSWPLDNFVLLPNFCFLKSYPIVCWLHWAHKIIHYSTGLKSKPCN